MKDNSATLAQYGLYDKPEPKQSTFSSLMRNFISSPKPPPASRITMIGSPETQAFVSDRNATATANANASGSTSQLPPRSGSPVQADESTTLATISRIQSDAISRHQPQIDQLEQSIDAGTKPSSQSFSIVSETLLQALLQLDSVNVRSEWTEARAARKAAVKAVQALLDRVDQVKDRAQSIPP